MLSFKVDNEQNIILFDKREIKIPKQNWINYLDIDKDSTLVKTISFFTLFNYFLFSFSSLIWLGYILELYMLDSLEKGDLMLSIKIYSFIYEGSANWPKLYIVIVFILLLAFIKMKKKIWIAKIKFHGKTYEFALKKSTVLKILNERILMLDNEIDKANITLDKIEHFVKMEEDLN